MPIVNNFLMEVFKLTLHSISTVPLAMITTTNTCSICLWRTQVVFVQGYLTSPPDSSDIPTNNTGCVLHKHIEHKFVVVCITYYTFDVDLMDSLQGCTWNYFVQESSVSYVISEWRSHSRRSHKTKPQYLIMLEITWTWSYKEFVECRMYHSRLYLSVIYFQHFLQTQPCNTKTRKPQA